MEGTSSTSEQELTMEDVLKEEQELEEDARAVLGASDDTECSYDKGYVSRQALYACVTCTPNDYAGVCLACCYACHDGHEVVELYTKRNFRCDCGNGKFQKKCTLQPNKEAQNLKNKYNQNFKGLYCSCNRPYPDPDDDVSDVMIQCVLCEDWCHGRHLESKLPDPEVNTEMICGTCMESHKFLYSYRKTLKAEPETEINVELIDPLLSQSIPSSAGDASSLPSTSSPLKEEGKVVMQASVASDVVSHPSVADLKSNGIKTEKDQINVDVKIELNKPTTPIKEKVSSTSQISGESSPGRLKIEPVEVKPRPSCKLQAIDADKDVKKGATFWPENWRSSLCKCGACVEMYEEAGCPFLLDPEDVVQAYEERGRRHNALSQYESGMSALSQLDRVKQMEAVRAYTSMKGALKEYLRTFVENKKTVREEDIKEFFEGMRKKQKLNNGVPHFCR